MLSPDRYRKCREAMVFHIAGDGQGTHFVIPCANDDGCIRIYFVDIGGRKLVEIVGKIMGFLFD